MENVVPQAAPLTIENVLEFEKHIAEYFYLIFIALKECQKQNKN